MKNKCEYPKKLYSHKVKLSQRLKACGSATPQIYLGSAAVKRTPYSEVKLISREHLCSKLGNWSNQGTCENMLQMHAWDFLFTVKFLAWIVLLYHYIWMYTHSSDEYSFALPIARTLNELGNFKGAWYNSDIKDFTLHIFRREKQLLISCWSKLSRKSKKRERKPYLEIFCFCLFCGIM